jgi:hypothetical protein
MVAQLSPRFSSRAFPAKRPSNTARGGIVQSAGNLGKIWWCGQSCEYGSGNKENQKTALKSSIFRRYQWLDARAATSFRHEETGVSGNYIAVSRDAIVICRDRIVVMRDVIAVLRDRLAIWQDGIADSWVRIVVSWKRIALRRDDIVEF